MKKGNWCEFLCKNIWVAAPPYSEGLAFLGTPTPYPAMDSSFSLQRAHARGLAKLWGVPDLSTGHPTRADVDGSKEVNCPCPAVAI